MSKALVYGIISSAVVIGASTTYFFPVIENINSFFQCETTKNTTTNDINTTPAELNSMNSNESKILQSSSSADNPTVLLDEDSLNELTKTKVENNPTKTKILEGEIPVSKNY
jgi:hypothetical protein